MLKRRQAEVGEIIRDETRLFLVRRAARDGQKDQLRERVGQLADELRGLEGQVSSKTKEMDFINEELKGVRELWTKRLVPITRVMVLEREAVRIQGEREHLSASIAQANGKSTETNLQISQIDRDLKSEVVKELRELQAKASELIERKIAADDQLNRIEIRAPQDGVVHQLSVHTVGGVVNAGEQLMLIVPEKDELIVEIKVAPQDIDQLRAGQRTILRFAAFNQRTTPEIDGTLDVISADIAQDQRTGANYYVGRIVIPKEQLAILKELRLIPGMPVEAFIQTQDRTVLSFLTKPLHDQIMKAFRER